MKFFKRRCSDPNPQLETLSTPSEIDGSLTTPCVPSTSENCNEAKKSSSGFSSWGKTWKRFKRSNPSEQLPADRTRKPSCGSLKKENSDAKTTSNSENNDGDQSELKLSQTDLGKVYDMYRNMNDTCTRPEPTMETGRKTKCLSENLVLSEQQLSDYLIMMKPNVQELNKIFSEFSEGDHKNKSARLRALPEEKKSKSKSRFRSLFSRSSKSDDESDVKQHSKNSSTLDRKTLKTFKRGDSSEQLRTDSGFLKNENEDAKSTSNSKHNDADLSELKLSQTDLEKLYVMYRNMTDTCSGPEHKTGRSAKCVSENLNLSEQQLLDYLIMMKSNIQELNKIFGESSQDDHKTNSGTLSALTEEKKSKSKFRSFFSRSSKSDDESDVKRHSRNSSVDGRTSLFNFIRPRRSSSDLSSSLPRTFKANENVYGSDSTKTISTDSPVESVVSGIPSSVSNSETKVQHKEKVENENTYYRYNDDDSDAADDDMIGGTSSNVKRTITCWGRGRNRASCKKRSRSRSDDSDTFSKKKSLKINQSSSKTEKLEDSSQDCCKKLSGLKLNQESTEEKENKDKNQSSNVLEKKYKCVYLKVGKYESVGIEIGQIYERNSASYYITGILPHSAAHRNSNLKLGDEVVSINGMQLEGFPSTIAKSYLEPENGELTIMIAPSEETTNTSTKIQNSFLDDSTSPLRRCNSMRDICNCKREVIGAKQEVAGPSKEVSSNNSNIERNRLVGLSDILSIKSEEDLDIITPVREVTRALVHVSALQDDINLFKKPQTPILSSAYRTYPRSLTGMRKFSYSARASSLPSSTVAELSDKIENGVLKKTVVFYKGPGCKSLGFSVVGGIDTPRGPIGIYVKTIRPQGQAVESGLLKQEDEIISINGKSLKGLTHDEAVSRFKEIKYGEVVMQIVRRPHAKLFSSPL